ncbi:uncharacterized protein BDR25DRAFT_307023 [Lindgomyces ingoldianus]|uniref:Uncharacterized protein n=1 Tax=Lindgomyces ingoldianus TaxID=673940 RepID=A0ACB6QCT2_9PLEO|nr:uncharacterized protein BDR25DRAFT_307023 [Lindgomyces ingoldianus]KAF2464670.1 hypothetical protein BDR25DRAFT_307023 [Lindgomyces ingoldianus]
MFNPLASNPVNQNEAGWAAPSEDILGNTQARPRGFTSSSQPGFSPHPPLRSAASIPDYGLIRGADRTNLSGAYRPNRGEPNWSHAEQQPPLRQLRAEEPRSSVRSGWTNASSFVEASGTERSSFATGRSSTSDAHVSLVSAERTDSQGIANYDGQGLEDEGGEEDGYAGLDIIDSYDAADVIESYFDDDDEEEHRRQTQDPTQHRRQDTSSTSSPATEARRSSSASPQHEQRVSNAAESHPVQHLHERRETRPISYIDTNWYPPPQQGSPQGRRSVSPLDTGKHTVQDSRSIQNEHSRPNSGQESYNCPERQSKGAPFLPPLQLSPTTLSYSPTGYQSPQRTNHSPTETRNSWQHLSGAGKMPQSPTEITSQERRRPSDGGVPQSSNSTVNPWRRPSRASGHHSPDLPASSHKQPSDTRSLHSPVDVYKPVALRRPSETGSGNNPEFQGHRRQSETGSRNSPELQGYHRTSETAGRKSPELQEGRHPSSAKFTPSPSNSPIELAHVPVWPVRSESKRETIRNELLEMQRLPKLPLAKSRLSRQDWAEIQTYSKKYATKDASNPGNENRGSQGKRPALAVQVPASKSSEPFPVAPDDHVPRRNSADFMDRRSKMFDLGTTLPRPPQKSHTFGPERPGDNQRNFQTSATSNQASIRPNSPLTEASPISPPSPTSPLVVMSIEGVPRDHYGFKKQTQLIGVKEYDDWYERYQVHVGRRRQKWQALMKKQDILLDAGILPVRFPERCDKVKRYARKGYPPEWRGNMWWFYSTGPYVLSQMPGLYSMLRLRRDELNEIDRELIERDLHRTFPDNDRFKPDPQPTPENPTGESDEEPKMIKDLREVLQCFALNNPSIGYCQSLNFIAGLLLLFLDGDCERVFVLLTIITQYHLPGAHARSLTNIEVNVLMMLVKDYLPKVWTSINDTDAINRGLGASSHPDSKFQRLPSVSISCTSWFMSLFVGALPIETVLRVWDAFLYEGPRALFRYALAIFKLGEPKLRAVSPDSPELFQIVQNLPRRCLDPNVLHDLAFVKKGFGSLTQSVIDEKRAFWRAENAKPMSGHAKLAGGEEKKGGLRRKASRRFLRKKD